MELSNDDNSFSGEVATTAQIAIRPDIDEAVTKIYTEGVKLQEYAEKAVLKTVEDVRVFSNDLTILGQLKKSIEEKRKEYTVPINLHLQEVNRLFKLFTTPIDAADILFRKKVKDFHAEQARIQAEQERINMLRMEAAQAEAELNQGEITEAVNLVEVTSAPKRVYSDMGTTAMVDNWRVEVIDFSLLPDEYKIPDQVKLNKVTRAGVRSIPGCRIWNDPVVRVTTK